MIPSIAIVLALAAPAERTGRDVAKLVDGERFAPIAAVADLPEPVRNELARLMRQRELSLADPGQPFQVTDVGFASNPVPRRRLIFAGRSKDLVVVHYERGGFAHVYALVVLRVSADGAEALGATYTKGRLPGLETLRDLGRHVSKTIFSY